MTNARLVLFPLHFLSKKKFKCFKSRAQEEKKTEGMILDCRKGNGEGKET